MDFVISTVGINRKILCAVSPDSSLMKILKEFLGTSTPDDNLPICGINFPGSSKNHRSDNENPR